VARVFEDNPPIDNAYAAGDVPLSATIRLTPNVTLGPPSAQDATGIITYTVAPTTTDYVIGVTTPAGYTPSQWHTGTLTVTAPLTSNTTYGPFEFGYFRPGTVTGAVRFDRDADNILFADDEPGMQGVTVTLRLGGSDVLITTTDATGAYTFTNVTPAISYTVRVTNPDTLNFELVTPAGGDNDMATTDDGNTYAETAPFSVTSGAAVGGRATAAVRGRATVTGQVWEDLDGDGRARRWRKRRRAAGGDGRADGQRRPAGVAEHDDHDQHHDQRQRFLHLHRAAGVGERQHRSLLHAGLRHAVRVVRHPGGCRSASDRQRRQRNRT
jgi:hypothetical protein